MAEEVADGGGTPGAGAIPGAAPPGAGAFGAVAVQDQTTATSTGSPGNVYLLSYAFNQDQSCFVCGTTAGFRVYTTSPVCEVHRRENSVAFQHRSVVLIAMLFKTNIFAMVTTADDDPSKGGLNKVHIWDDQKGKFVGELRSRNEVKGVVLRRDIIAMVCEYAIYVYTCDKLRVILHLTTNANTRGLCVLASASDPWILCCPGQSTGAVRVQVGQDDNDGSHVFEAHQTGLAALTLNSSGSLVATASEKGTVVKVFQTSDGQCLYRLRRSTRPAIISCLTFRPDDRFLAVVSSSSTVHIFKLDSETATREADADHASASAPASARSSGSLSGRLGPGAPGGGEDTHGLDAGAGASASGASPGSGGAEGAGGFSMAEATSRGSIASLGNLASRMQQAVTKVASHAAAETVSDVVKGALPYFNDLRSFATFRLPDLDSSGQAAVDARSKQARILGPQLAFHRTEPKLFVLHYSGVLYECGFRPDHDANLGTEECSFVCATTWFAVRPDFKVQGPCSQVPTVAGGAADGDEEAEEWQLL